MNKREFNAAIVSVCAGGVAAILIGMLIGGEAGGMFLLACALALLAWARRYARRHRGNVNHGTRGQTAEQVARREMIEHMAGWPCKGAK